MPAGTGPLGRDRIRTLRQGGGLSGFTKSVAQELASRNILANVVAPGFIETDMTAAMTEDAKKALYQQIPLERLGKPQDIAGLVAFLASEHASYITGQHLSIDGGFHITA